jgi:hypothetical protein
MSLLAVLYKVALAAPPATKHLGDVKPPGTPPLPKTPELRDTANKPWAHLASPEIPGANLGGPQSSAGSLFPVGSGWGSSYGAGNPSRLAPMHTGSAGGSAIPSSAARPVSAPVNTPLSYVMNGAGNPIQSAGPAPAAAQPTAPPPAPPSGATTPAELAASGAAAEPAPTPRISKLTGKPFGYNPNDSLPAYQPPAAPAAAPKVNYTDADNDAYRNYHLPTDPSWTPELQAGRGSAMDSAAKTHQAQTDKFMREIDSSAARSMKIQNPEGYERLVNSARDKYGIRGMGAYDTMWRGAGAPPTARPPTARPAAPVRAPGVISSRPAGRGDNFKGNSRVIGTRPATAADLKNLPRR